MFCSKCGKENSDEAVYCSACGNKVGSSHVESGVEEVRYKPRPEGSPTSKGMPTIKLAVLSVTTFGLYDIYWFYKQWKNLREIKQLNITPWARALFAPLYSYSLFKHVFELAGQVSEDDQPPHPSAGVLAAIYMSLSAASRLPHPYWLVGFGTTFPLIVVQDTLNYYWKKTEPNKSIRTGFSAWELVVAVVGGVILLVTLLDTLSY